MTRRQELLPEITRLRKQGLPWAEIGARLGLATSTVQEYYTDPDGTRANARKARNDGVCVDCGAATKDSGAAVPPERCGPCSRTYKRTLEYRLQHPGGSTERWSDRDILAALRSAAVDGHLTIAAYEAARAASPHPLPCLATITGRFGFWAAAVRHAGLRCQSRGAYRGRYTADDARTALRWCIDELGYAPSITEYTAWAQSRPRLDAPSQSMVARLCGGWLSAIESVVSETPAPAGKDQEAAA